MSLSNVDNNNNGVQPLGSNSLKAGMKNSAAKTKAKKSIFTALDKNGDGVLSKSETKNILVTGKVKNAKGQLVEKQYVKLKNLENGRSLVADKDGKQWVMAQDGVILKSSYVEDKQSSKDQGKYLPDKKGLETTNFLAREYNSAQKAFDAQMKKDGWAGDLADGISRAWTWATDSKNSANYVREDLKNQKKNVQDLQKAAKQGQAQFNAKFKEIYGVNYNQKAMDDYMQNPTEANYKKAFGTKHKNIKTRVDKYNQSQDTGAVAVKTTTKVAAGVAIGVATGGTGLVALGAAAAATAATSVVVEETDAFKVKDAVTKGKIEFREGTDHKKILTDAAWDGTSVLAGGAVGKIAGTVIKGAGKMAVTGRAAVNVAGDVAMGAAQEYVETGQISTAGVATNALMSGVGSAVTSGVLTKGYKAIKKGFSNVADNVPHRFSTKKADLPVNLFDADGNILAGGASVAGAGGSFFSRIKSKMGLDGSTKIDTDLKHQLQNNGFDNIISSVEANPNMNVSNRLREALNNKLLVTDLPASTNLHNISQHVSDGEVCSVNGKLFVNDNGNAVPINLTREKFEELFPRLGTATFAQPGGTQVCTIQATLNSMLESAGGRAQLYTMLEQDGKDIIVNLRGGRSPVRFTEGKPVNINLREHNANLFSGDAPGIEMLQQAVLVDRIRIAAQTPEVVDINELSTKSLINMANKQTAVSNSAIPLTGKNPQTVMGKNQIQQKIESFRAGEDMISFVRGGHQMAVVDYDSMTHMVKYYDSQNAGITKQESIDDFIRDCAALSFTKRQSSALNTSILSAEIQVPSPPLQDAQRISAKPHPKVLTESQSVSKRIEVTGPESNFISNTTELSNKAVIVAYTAEGSPIGASITQSNVIIKKNGKYTPIPIPDNGTYQAILEKSTNTFLVIKNDNGKVSITTSETPNLVAVPEKQSKLVSQSQKQQVELTNNSITQSKPVTSPKAQLEIPEGWRDYGQKIMGKRAIVDKNGVVMYESKGQWKRLN